MASKCTKGSGTCNKSPKKPAEKKVKNIKNDKSKPKGDQSSSTKCNKGCGLSKSKK